MKTREKSEASGPAERGRERGKGHLAPGRSRGGRQNGTASAKTKSGGVDPVAVLCGVLADESASLEERTEAAWLLLPFYHPRVVKMASLLRIFLLGPLLTRSLCDQRQ